MCCKHKTQPSLNNELQHHTGVSSSACGRSPTIEPHVVAIWAYVLHVVTSYNVTQQKLCPEGNPLLKALLSMRSSCIRIFLRGSSNASRINCRSIYQTSDRRLFHGTALVVKVYWRRIRLLPVVYYKMTFCESVGIPQVARSFEEYLKKPQWGYPLPRLRIERVSSE